jgi:hypothetical protein
MKITKTQLKRIIKEEKAKLLKEESATVLLGRLHDAINALYSVMEPIELASELRGIAADIDREDDRRFAQERQGL